MKIKKVEAICRGSKTLLLASGGGVQWIGDGGAAYPLYGFPPLDKDSIFTIFDVPEDKRSIYAFRYAPELLNRVEIAEYVRGEKMLEILPLSITVQGVHVELLVRAPDEGDGVIIPIKSKYLTPFAGEKNWTLWERRDTAGVPYVLVKKGITPVGVIVPYTVLNEENVARLETVVRLAKGMELSKEGEA